MPDGKTDMHTPKTRNQPAAEDASARPSPKRPREPATTTPDRSEAALAQRSDSDGAKTDSAAAGDDKAAAAGGEVAGRRRGLIVQWLHDSPSWLSSLVLHSLVLLLLAIWVMPSPPPPPKTGLRFVEEDATDDMPEELVEPAEDMPDVEIDQIENAMPETELIEEEPDLSAFEEMEAASVELVDFGTELSLDNLLTDANSGMGNALSGRGKGGRGALVRRGGGTQASEEAVTRALNWLVRHQRPDGSWSFDHTGGKCQARCRNPGELRTSYNGATALALMPFLGAGQTHLEGEYKKSVAAGLRYLTQTMKVSQKGGSLVDGGTMYTQGIGAIVLCEAYAMTRDKSLERPAQLALDYIAYAQDPVGGGWRYTPQQPGDTSAVGWQIMALKSGHMGDLLVRPDTVKKAVKFLDSVQADGGSGYYYMERTKTIPRGTTAVGLLCRMYLGWGRNHEALTRGIERLAKSGPSTSDFYYNYYATQVMFQFTGAKGDLWKKWNEKMRDFLVRTQAIKDHEKGSWYAGSSLHSAKKGGRLYTTALGAMILEVYYRHMPIYGQEAVDEEFPE